MTMPGNDAPVSTAVVDLSGDQRRRIAEKKATCPFIGSLVETGALAVHNTAERPLARVEDVVAFGDSGGGNLGSVVLKLFARGNHSMTAGAAGKLDTRTPDGTFSLDLAGSQGAHPGHSGILLGDPDKLDAGRFSAADFDRLAKHADDNGRLTSQAVGEFIAKNIARDPASKRLSAGSVALALAGAGGEVADTVFAWLGRRRTERDAVELAEKLAGLAREDNLLGSAGEFGLKFALVANRPGPRLTPSRSPTSRR